MLTFRLVASSCLLAAAGCVASQPVNPSFPVTTSAATQLLNEASAHPAPLRRPLVVIGGFVDPGFAANVLAANFRSYTGDSRIIAVPIGFETDFGRMRKRVIDAVQAAFPSSDPSVTNEVDVVGFSLGGLVARYSANPALPGEPPRRLRIGRLFTISSPLAGAAVAERYPLLLNPLQENMRPGSRFLTRVDQSQVQADLYPVYSYVCLGDDEIGPHNAAVPGQTPWWVSEPAFIDSHDWAFLDPRIKADIVSRLRGSKPLTSDPPAAVPVEQ